MLDDTIPPLLVTSQASVVGMDRQLRRRVDAGELHRLRAGVFVDATVWNALDFDARFRVAVHGASRKLMVGTQFSHASAVALWHLPGIGAWPNRVDVLVAHATGGRSSRAVSRHIAPLDPLALTIDSAVVTSLPRTVIDSARTSDFLRAVVVADAALATPPEGSFRHLNGIRPITRVDLNQLLAHWSPTDPGIARARRVLAFADGRSGSPGESISRVQCHLAGFPPPELQVPFSDERGFIGYADFYWPELDLIGEFDGDVKYRSETFRRGRLPEHVVLDEKRREDRLRRVVRGFERWDWAVARDQRQLVARLAPHGLIALR